MQIDSRARLSGVLLIDIGRMFRQAGLDGVFSVAFVRDQLEMDERRVMRLLRALQREGFVESSSDRWHLTTESVPLRAAAAAKPILRSTADRLLAELLLRIDRLNKSPDFLARFERAIVFGSYLGSAERLSDLDVAIQWQRREMEYDVHLRANNRK